MFLLGRQAMLGHDPPTYFRSIAATRSPRPAKVHAAIVPPVPLPRITRSYSSMFFTTHDETDCVPTSYSHCFLPCFKRVTIGGRAAALSPIFWTSNFSYLRHPGNSGEAATDAIRRVIDRLQATTKPPRGAVALVQSCAPSALDVLGYLFLGLASSA
jgi:hypothetical protein